MRNYEDTNHIGTTCNKNEQQQDGKTNAEL